MQAVTGGEVVEGKLRKINIANESKRRSMFSGRGENPLCGDPSHPRRSASAGSRQFANTADKPPTYILCCFITADYGVFCVGDYEEAEWRDPAVDPSVYNTPI